MTTTPISQISGGEQTEQPDGKSGINNLDKVAQEDRADTINVPREDATSWTKPQATIGCVSNMYELIKDGIRSS